jgi:hypothetical protein
MGQHSWFSIALLALRYYSRDSNFGIFAPHCERRRVSSCYSHIELRLSELVQRL